MRLYVVAGAYAAWLFATELLFYLAYGGEKTTLEISVALGLIPAAAQILLLGFNPYGLAAPVKGILVFLLIVLLSYLGHAGWISVIFFIELLFIFGMGILVASSPDPNLLRTTAALFSLPSAAFLIFVALTGEQEWGRLAAHGIEPNWWGFMGMGLAASAFALRSRLLTVLCFGAGFYITYAASSRGSMISIVLGSLVVAFASARKLQRRHAAPALLAALGALVIWILFSHTITAGVSNAIVDALRINDPYRGVDSGFSGREEIWADVIDIWQRSPLVGVGFHQHQLLTKSTLPAHQSYLGMLADTGIFGLLWYVGFLAASLVAGFRIVETQTRNLVLFIVSSYTTLGLFEAHVINGANPTSLLFIFSCIVALSQASLRRAANDLPPQMHAASTVFSRALL